jgi:hypothetical protein
LGATGVLVAVVEVFLARVAFTIVFETDFGVLVTFLWLVALAIWLVLIDYKGVKL